MVRHEPSALSDKAVMMASDVYSFGCILWEVSVRGEIQRWRGCTWVLRRAEVPKSASCCSPPGTWAADDLGGALE